MYRLRFLALLSILLVAVLALTGCGGNESTAAADNDNDSGAAVDDAGDADDTADDGVTISATEFKFDPGSFTVPADTPTTVTLSNEGVVEHDITIDDADVVIYAAAGKSEQGEVTLPAGEHVFYCSIPGHRDAGMEGTVTAEG